MAKQKQRIFYGIQAAVDAAAKMNPLNITGLIVHLAGEFQTTVEVAHFSVKAPT
mgnify:CR=1 FL=1